MFSYARAYGAAMPKLLIVIHKNLIFKYKKTHSYKNWLTTVLRILRHYKFHAQKLHRRIFRIDSATHENGKAALRKKRLGTGAEKRAAERRNFLLVMGG